MSFGDRVWDAAGNLTLEISDRLMRVIGTMTVSAAGSLANSAFSENPPFAIVIPAGGTTMESAWLPVSVSFLGSTMSWSAGDPSIVVYGVF